MGRNAKFFEAPSEKELYLGSYEVSVRDKFLFYTEVLTAILVVFNTWVITYQTFQLNNFNFIDTTTITQALSSTIFSHLFFWDSQPYFDFFSVHATSLFLAILPFYSIFPNFIGIYAIQNTIVYSAAIPIYLIFNKTFNDRKFAFVFSVAYLLYWGVFGLYSAEEIIMFIGLAIFAVYFMETGKKVPFIISFVLMLSTIEFAPFIGLFFFLYVVIRTGILVNIRQLISRIITVKEFLHKDASFFIISSLLLSVSFLFLDMKMTLYFSGGTHPIYQNIVGTNFFSASSLLTGLMTNPMTKMLNFMMIDGPFLFLALFDPIIVLQIPWLLVTVITSANIYYSLGYYGAFVTAFAPIGAIFGLKRITKGMPPEHRKRTVRKFVTVILVLNILSFAAIGYVQTYENDLTAHVIEGDQGVVYLSEQLKQGDLVEVGYNALPVVSIFDWNDILYQNNSAKYMFWGYQPGYYNNIAGYGFYAADGPYVLYEKNYTSPPKFNYYNYSDSEEVSQSASFNFFSPPGNYSLSLNISDIHYSSPLAIGKSSGENFTLLAGKAIAIPFEVNRSSALSGVLVPLSYSGPSILSAFVSDSMSPQPFGALSTAHGNFPYFKFSNISIRGNTTYYIWVFIQTPTVGNSEEISFPKSASTGAGYIGNVNTTGFNNISSLNFTVPVTLFVKSSTPRPIEVSVAINGKVYNTSEKAVATIVGPIKITNGGEIPMTISTNITNYIAYSGSDFSISFYAENSSMPSFYLLNNPYPALVISLISVIALITAINVVDLRKYKPIIHSPSRTIALLAFISFWAFYALGVEGIVPFLYNFTVFKTIGVILALALLSTVITYDWP